MQNIFLIKHSISFGIIAGGYRVALTDEECDRGDWVGLGYEFCWGEGVLQSHPAFVRVSSVKFICIHNRHLDCHSTISTFSEPSPASSPHAKKTTLTTCNLYGRIIRI